MPKKIRELEAELQRAGFAWSAGKGSHRKWRHPTGSLAILSGKAGDDAKRYQEKQVAAAIAAAQDQTNAKN